jgi:hypothetical protein
MAPAAETSATGPRAKANMENSLPMKSNTSSSNIAAIRSCPPLKNSKVSALISFSARSGKNTNMVPMDDQMRRCHYVHGREDILDSYSIGREYPE